ncbi:MAG: hypothetical protein WED05_07865 [Candidatus Atabeyarchaeum deiterrae]
MIYDLYVISNQNGCCIYHQGFGTTLVNSDLVAGLLTAMLSFMKEVRGDEMKVMISGNSKFVFNQSPGLIFVALVDLNPDEHDVSMFLEEVKKLFTEKYPEKDQVQPLSGDDPISQEIAQLLFTSDKPTGKAKPPLVLGRRLSKLIAPELAVQKDALTNLYGRVAKSKDCRGKDHDLEEKYRKEIENLNRLIEETQN